MSQGLCPSCGAVVSFATGQTEVRCRYCDSLATSERAEAQFSQVKNSKFGGTLLIAETAQEGGSYEEALNYFNKVIEQQPDFADAWLNKGICTVRMSKIGDLKIPEAISSWKAAMKFAKQPDAMKKRVALEINNVVTDFYPVLERHYLEFHNLDNSLQEHGSRFMLLESALSFAMDLNPTATIAKNGVSLCDRFVASIKTAARSDANDAGAKLFLQKDWKGALGSALTAGSKEKLASDLATSLQRTKDRYTQAAVKVDPAFAREVDLKAEVERQKTAKNNMDANQGCLIIAIGLCFISGCSAVVRTLKANGLMETTQNPSEHVGPAVFFGLCSVSLLGVVVYAASKVSKDKKQKGRDVHASVQHSDHGKYALMLKEVPADKKIQAISACREIRPGLSLSDAKKLVESVPQVLIRSDDREGLERALVQIGVLGAEAEIETTSETKELSSTIA